MLVRIENYTFKPIRKKGKWEKYIDEFLESKEQSVAYKVSDMKELGSANTGLHKSVKAKNLKGIVKIRISYKDLVVGLERVVHEG